MIYTNDKESIKRILKVAGITAIIFGVIILLLDVWYIYEIMVLTSILRENGIRFDVTRLYILAGIPIILVIINFDVFIQTKKISSMVDRGQYVEAKSKTLIWTILGFIIGCVIIIGMVMLIGFYIFSIISFISCVIISTVMLIAYLKFDPLIRAQMWQYPARQPYQQPYQQPQYPQYIQRRPVPPPYQHLHQHSQVQKYSGSQVASVSPKHIHDIYSANTPEEKPPSFDFGDFFSYQILHKIGSGGFSDVYAVERGGKQYAMKIPKGVDLRGSDTLELKEKDLEGYGKEAEIWVMLTEREPQAVVNLVDAGIRPFPWFVMEIGERKLGDSVGNAATQEKLRTISELLGKLDRIHHYGVVHKDIKPDNILFAGGNWKFTDFGLSKVLSMSSKSSAGFSGTMFYMAPEQVSKKHFGNTDWRTDIWQMGVLAYEVLTGHTPFEAEDAFEITSSILHNEPIPGTRYGMDERVWNVVKKALEKRKEERWQSAGEFRRELEGVKI